MAHRFSIGVRLLLLIAIVLSAGLASYAPPLAAATPQPTPTIAAAPALRYRPARTTPRTRTRSSAGSERCPPKADISQAF